MLYLVKLLHFVLALPDCNTTKVYIFIEKWFCKEFYRFIGFFVKGSKSTSFLIFSLRTVYGLMGVLLYADMFSFGLVMFENL